MRDVTWCSFVKCKSEDTGKLQFFPFPVHRPDICHYWLENCGREQLKTLPLSILRQRKVCELHFESTCFNANASGKLGLSKDAVPILDPSEYENFLAMLSMNYGVPSMSYNAPSMSYDDSSRLTSVNEMESLDNTCFVCDKAIITDKWKYKLKTTATKKTKVPVSDLIQLLVGDEFEVLVGERDAVCHKCMKSLNEMDALTEHLTQVKAGLSQLLSLKYGLTSDDDDPLVYLDSLNNPVAKMLLSCEKCDFTSNKKKEWSEHMKIHIATAKTPDGAIRKQKTGSNYVDSEYNAIMYWTPDQISSTSVTRKTPPSLDKKAKSKNKVGKNVSSIAVTPNVSQNRISLESITNKNKMKLTAAKGKSLKPVKPVENKKKVKLVYQCSLCDAICKSKGSMTTHVRKIHKRNKIVLADSEDDYEDIQTLDDELSSTEKILDNHGLDFLDDESTNIEEISDKNRLDFLDDWDDDELEDIHPNTPKINQTDSLQFNKQKESSKQVVESEDCPIFGKVSTKSISDGQNIEGKSLNTQDSTFVANNLTKQMSEFEEEYDMEDHDEDFIGLSKPTCMFCRATFFSLEAVKDHVKLIHGDNRSNLNLEEFKDQKSNVLARTTPTHTNNWMDAEKDSMRQKKLYKCNLCGVRKLTYQLIQIHRNVHRRQRSLQCKFCGSKLRNLASLKAHHLKCRKIGLASKKCKHCSLFFYANDLKKHVKSVHILLKRGIIRKDMSDTSKLRLNNLSQKNPSITLKNVEQRKTKLQSQSLNKKHYDTKCDSCDAYFTHGEQLLNHKIRHEIQDCFKFGVCIWCSKLFGDKASLEIHMKNEHGPWLTKKSCSLCSNKKFFSKREFKLHFLRNHFPQKTKVILKEISEYKDSTVQNEAFIEVIKELHDITGEGSDVESKTFIPIYFCAVCDFQTNVEEEIKNHQVTHKENYCNICQSLFKRKECLAHVKLHSHEFLGEKCSLCDKLFHDDIHLMNHLQINHPDCKNKCHMCTESFCTLSDLMKHRYKTHGDKLPHVKTCKECLMKFFSKKSFRFHKEFAHRPSPSCKFCDKTFSSFKRLVMHEKAHLPKVKSAYKCGVCGKVLKTLFALKTHKVSHNGNRSQVCGTCGKEFKSLFSFREHSASHCQDLQKRYYCETCGKSFYFYDTHFRHRKVHLDSSR